MLGVALVVLALGIGYFTWGLLAPDAPEEEPIDLTAAVTGPGSSRPAVDPKAEQEAGVLLQRARDVAANQNANLAISLLERLTTSYPGTRAASEAKEALARPAQNLPLFLDRPAVSAAPDNAEKSPGEPTEPVKAPVVDAAEGNPSAAKNVDVGLTLPSNTPEASRPSPGVASPGTTRPAVGVVPSNPLPKGYRPRPDSTIHESGWPLEIVGDRDGAPMVLVPGGTFGLGRDGGDTSEGPYHQVRLGTFYIDQHEVSVRQFNLFQTEAGKRTERVRALARDAALSNLDVDGSKPVVMVTAREASDFAAWAGKRLPTEAQWEAAARTPDGRIYPWGTETFSPRAKTREIKPVMAFPRDQSPYGAFDLAGNAAEWTKDWFDARYYQTLRGTTADNPTGPSNRPRTGQLTIKGASLDWVVTRREGIKFDTRLPYLGFRCVLPVEGETGTPATPGSPPTSSPRGGAGAVVPF